MKEEGIDNPCFDTNHELETQIDIDPPNDKEVVLEDSELNVVQKYIDQAHEKVSAIFAKDNKYKSKLNFVLLLIFCILYLVYFICAIIYYVQPDLLISEHNVTTTTSTTTTTTTTTTEPPMVDPIEWCNGLGFLIILTSLVMIWVII